MLVRDVHDAAPPPAGELTVVVLNYETPDLTIRCLASLEAQVGAARRVIVVDNASRDGSADRIDAAIAEHGWSAWAEILRSPRNGGFAAGNNLGLAYARASRPASAYVMLNSDAVVLPGALDSLLRAARAHPDVGIVGPRIDCPGGGLDVSAFRDHTPLAELVVAARTGLVSRLFPEHCIPLASPGAPIRPDWLAFACVLVRAEVLDDIGGLDEGFFMYFEDADYCRRARAAGWGLLYWPEARVLHVGGGSSGFSTRDGMPRRMPRYYFESRARYFARHHGISGPVRANLAWTAGTVLAQARVHLGRGGHATSFANVRDTWRGTLRARPPVLTSLAPAYARPSTEVRLSIGARWAEQARSAVDAMLRALRGAAPLDRAASGVLT